MTFFDHAKTVAPIYEASNAEECTRRFKEALTSFDITTFSCGEVDVADRSKAVFYAMDWSDEWRRFYTTNFIDRDPLLRILGWKSDPFLWSETLVAPTLKTEELYVMKLAEKNGWIDGFVLPIARNGTRKGLVSLVSSRRLDAVTDKPPLILLSSIYHERLRSLITPSDFPIPPLGLSVREIECLTLVASGHNDRQVASELSISLNTAQEHIDRARQRLGARTRTQAVAMAMAFGIVRSYAKPTSDKNTSSDPPKLGDV